MIVIGIDPGKSGGIAAINRRDFIALEPMPVSSDGLIDGRRLAEWIVEHTGHPHGVWAKNERGHDFVDSEVSVWVEDVHAMPGQGVCSMFSFGRGLGCIEGVCGALGLAVHRVRPQEWVKEAERVLGDPGVDRGASGKEKAKGRGAVWAKRIWPHANLLATERSKKPHDGMADALLIAWYGMRFIDSAGNI
jgi:crossover junction endodeoxyribonuclease RuvC